MFWLMLAHESRTNIGGQITPANVATYVADGSVSTGSRAANVLSNYIIPSVSSSLVCPGDFLTLTLTHSGGRITYCGNYIFSANVIDSSSTVVVVNMILNWGGVTYNGGSYVFQRQPAGGGYMIQGSIPLFISISVGGIPGTLTVKVTPEFFFTSGNISYGTSGPHGNGSAGIVSGGFAFLQELRV